MELSDSDARLLICVEALCDSLFRDEEWSQFRHDCCNIELDSWHPLDALFDGILTDIWSDIELEPPALWVRIALTPCGRWRICNLYCTELTAVVATALLGSSHPDDLIIH
jgi:hypothetical protein